MSNTFSCLLPTLTKNIKKKKTTKFLFFLTLPLTKSTLLIWFPFAFANKIVRAQQNPNEIASAQKLSEPVSGSWQEIAFLGEWLGVCKCAYVL